MKRCFYLAIAAFLLLLNSGVAVQKPESSPIRGPFRASDLVELIKLDPTIKLDIRYATSHNFTGRIMYPEARAFLQRPRPRR